MDMQTDVIIVGAGAAGLMAAREVAATGVRVLVLEGRDRIGGRIHTINGDGFSQAAETGAEFVHGDLKSTLQLLREAGMKTLPSGGTAWRSKEGRIFQEKDFIENVHTLVKALQQQKEEISIRAFLEANFNGAQYEGLKKSVKGYVEGYYAGELDRASVLAMKEEWEQDEAPQHSVQGGYSALMQFLYNQSITHGAIFQFEAPVKNITWGFEKVVVKTNNGNTFTAKKVIITVPTAVLQAKSTEAAIEFQPQLIQHQHAFKELGYGGVIKILMEFKTAFWYERFHLKNLSFLFSEEAIPTWWTQHPQSSNLLTGWCAGPNADRLKNKSEAELFQIAIQSLAHIFNVATQELENTILVWRVFNWATDPFTLGGYSYVTTTTKAALRIIKQPVQNTLYFAGEALYDNFNTGTVEAALHSGNEVAQQVLRSFTPL